MVDKFDDWYMKPIRERAKKREIQSGLQSHVEPMPGSGDKVRFRLAHQNQTVLNLVLPRKALAQLVADLQAGIQSLE